MDSSMVGDYNGDGKPEEVALQRGYGDYAQLLMRNGDGTFTPTQDIFSFSQYNYAHLRSTPKWHRNQ